MNYSSFCDYLFAALMNQMESGTTITKEHILKNNNVFLDAFVLHIPSARTAPVIYLEPLYQNYRNGYSIASLAQMILSRLKKEIPLTFELSEQIHTLDSAYDRIVFRLISQEDNEELLKDVPWIPYLNLAVIFYLHLGTTDENQITTLIHNSLADIWKLSPDELYQFAKHNTPRLCPVHIGNLEDLIIGWDESKEPLNSSNLLYPIYILSNDSGVFGASCILYEGIIKDFADQIGSDLIILPSSIHEVLILPDFHDRDYEDFRHIIQNINIEDVPKEDILSNELYLYHRGSSDLIIWTPCIPDSDKTCGTESL